MVQLRLHPRREQQLLLTACTTRTVRTAPAVRPLPGISAQVLRDLRVDDPTPGDHHRYDADRLLPRHAAVRRVVPARIVLDDIDTVTADVAAGFAARPELRHDTAVLMALAPIVAMLKGVEL